MGSYLLRKANQTVPLEILQAQFANNSVYIGVAVADEGVVQVATFKTVEQLSAALSTFADADVHIYFSNADNGVEDHQPYVLLKAIEDNKVLPLLTCILDGDYSSYNKTDSTFSDAYHCVEDAIKPDLEMIKVATDGDMDKIWKIVGSDNFRDKMAKLWIGYGTIAFINADGESKIYENSKNSQNFEWGHASRMYQLGASAPAPVVKAGRTLAAALTAEATASGVEVVRVAPAAPPVPAAPAAPAPAASPSALPENYLKGTVKGNQWFPPRNLTGKPLKAVIRAANKELNGVNELPAGFNKNNYGPIIIPPHKLNPPAVKSLADLPKVVGQTVLAAPSAPAISSDTATQEVEPILDQKVWDAVKDDFLTRFDFTKKLVSEEGKFLVDPEDLGANESKYPTFVEKLGLERIEDVLHFDYEDCQDLNRKYPDAGAVLVFNLINAHIGLLQQLNTVKDRLAKHEPPTVVPAPKTALAPSAPAPSGRRLAM